MLDELAEHEIDLDRLSVGALELAELPYLEPSDSHTIVFTV